MIKNRLFYFTAIFSLIASVNHAQSDFQRVYDIFQAKCTTCHGGGSPQGNLDLSASQTEVYNALVNANPTNPAAAAKGNKLISPGNPNKSFLMRKLANPGWDDYYDVLEVAEGSIMPAYPSTGIENYEIEMIRQWILHGASNNQSDVNMDALEEYYTEGGLAFIERPAPPAAGEGFQLRMGPIFLAPQEEQEFFQYVDAELSGAIESNRFEVFMNDESHHFILYLADEDNPIPPPGLIPIDEADATIDMGDESVIAVWQNAHNVQLPEKTGFFWDEETVFDLNFHAKNYSGSQVLPVEVYLNIYTQESGTAETEMFADLFPIGATSGQFLQIPPGGNLVTITDHLKTNFNFPMYIWKLSSHTHKTGEDYDIYLRNPNGTKGEQIFEGFFDFTYTFNQGFYDWEHPPVRNFEEPLYVNLKDGLIQEAKYINDSGSTLYWGNTTDDEMMLFYAHYTKEFVVSTEEPTVLPNQRMSIQPNPVSDFAKINYQINTASNVQLEIYDLLGKKITTIANEMQQPGHYSFDYAPKESLSKGLYLARLVVDGSVSTQKFSYIGQ